MPPCSRILSANANYQNSYLIFAVCGAGAVVCLSRGLWWRALVILGIGVVAALSLVPYVNIIRQFTTGGAIRQKAITPGNLFMEFCQVFDSARWVLLPALVLLVVLLAVAVVSLAVRYKRAETPALRAALYALLVILIGVATLYRFMLAAGFPTFPWHYIPFLGLVAIALDMAADRIIGETALLRGARLALVILVMVVSACPLGNMGPLWTSVHVRRTNMDLIANDIAGAAAAKDFVLVCPFWYSYSFKYYYKGAAPWSTLPVVPADRIDLEYDSIKPLMSQADPLAPTLSAVRQTLQAGGRVWVAGRLPVALPGTLPPTISPAPDPVYGWDNVQYMTVWSLQASYFLSQHAVRFIPGVEEGDKNRVNALEHGRISMAEGWRD